MNEETMTDAEMLDWLQSRGVDNTDRQIQAARDVMRFQEDTGQERNIRQAVAFLAGRNYK